MPRNHFPLELCLRLNEDRRDSAECQVNGMRKVCLLARWYGIYVYPPAMGYVDLHEVISEWLCFRLRGEFGSAGLVFSFPWDQQPSEKKPPAQAKFGHRLKPPLPSGPLRFHWSRVTRTSRRSLISLSWQMNEENLQIKSFSEEKIVYIKIYWGYWLKWR